MVSGKGPRGFSILEISNALADGFHKENTWLFI